MSFSLVTVSLGLDHRTVNSFLSRRIQKFIIGFVGHVPTGAVLAGNTAGGEPLYVGRAHHEGSLTPGKIHRNHGCIYIPFNGREESILHYEVLVAQNRADWVHASAHGPLPLNAIFVGNDSDGSPIYVGRAFHNGDQIPAKVIPSKNVAYGTH